MSTVGQAVGGAVGGIAGALLGGLQGGMTGFSLGMMVGSFLDPPKHHQTYVNQKADLQFDSNSNNVPIQIVYGVNRISGNFLWAGNQHVEEVTTETVGKKGGSEKKGGSQNKTNVLYADLALGLCEGEINALLDIFVGDHRATNLEGLDYTMYLGTKVQSADPRLVQDLGELAPAFRNTAYVAMTANLGASPSVPTISAEVNGIILGLHQHATGGYPYIDPAAYTFATLVNADGSWLAFGHPGGYYNRSTDYGATWTRTLSFARIEGWSTYCYMADHKGHPNRVYATYRSTGVIGNLVPFDAGCYLYRSDDAGQTWCDSPAPLKGDGPWQHDPIDTGAILTIDNTEEVSCFSLDFIGMIGATEVNWTGCVYHSTDGGVSFGMTQAHQAEVHRLSYETRMGFIWDGIPYESWDYYGQGVRAYQARSGVRGSIYFPGTDLAFIHIPTFNAGYHWGGTLFRSDDHGRTFTARAEASLDLTREVSSNSTIWDQTGTPVYNSGVKLDDYTGVFANADGTVLVTHSGGAQFPLYAVAETGGMLGEMFAAAGVMSLLNPLSILMMVAMYVPSWYVIPTGLDQIFNIAVNSWGIVACGGIKDGIGAVALSLTKGLTWTIHPTLGKEPDVGLHRWSWVGGSLFAEDHICFGVGFNMDWRHVTPDYAGATITCAGMVAPSSCGNPALAVYDLLTNNRYGLGISSSMVSASSIRSCSTYCLEQIPTGLSSVAGYPMPLTEQRFCLDHVLDTERPLVDHLRDMLASFRGYLTWSQGKVKLKIDQPEPTVQSFGMGQIIGDTFTWKKQSLRERANVVRVEFVEPGARIIDATGQTPGSTRDRFVQVEGQAAQLHMNAEYKTYRQDFVEASQPWDIELTGERREKVLKLTPIKRATQAQRMAQYYLNRAVYCQNACAFRVGVNALRAEVGDVIAVTHDIPRWAGKLFRIVEIEEAESDELLLNCLEYNEAIYNDWLGVQPHAQGPIVGNIPGQNSLLDAPPHVARLTAYERPGEGTIEVNYTRMSTRDLFGGVDLYRRVGELGAWQYVGRQLSVAPTAYLASHLHTITLVQSLEG